MYILRSWGQCTHSNLDFLERLVVFGEIVLREGDGWGDAPAGHADMT